MPSRFIPPSAPQVQDFDCKNVDPSTIVQALITTGGVLLRNFIPNKKILSEIEKDVRPHINADTPWKGDFFPPETRRVYGLAGKSSTFMHHIVANSIYQSVCDKLLSSTHRCYIGDKIEESLSPPQLCNTLVLSIGPGARDQELHRDDMIHHNALPEISAEDYAIGRDTGIGLFVAGKPVTRANGATRFIPGSHLWDTMRPSSGDESAVYAEMEPGDAFIMLSSCYHGGSANNTSNEERLLYSCFMTKGYLRQEENQYLAVPQEAVKNFPLGMQRLIGYNVSKPFLGWVDLDDPRKALYGSEWKGSNGADLL
ncbi:hypothetical protein M409DRAFT_16313 [Zasmidium cellare ATCC 36951]|uniref:Phytanoyl-CoA dioxygenase family protein n=1 Tax=Zasmidium cellare ATCC 36951 TaxID=1080233 RepID=A0A6A6D3S8_ZASCE|nr:uncharacterized protein M409DRAFT_16313 [Zasmidium cellare ATCC 36951]KAF2174037.1 hypothetical protein M409DRAFT_16313 [Zasmidium cellare ATCC 36951]